MKIGDRFNFSEIKDSVRHCYVQEVVNLLNTQRMKFWSWGSNNFVNLYDKGLKFTVRAQRHYGYVYIVVNGMDLYDVYLVSIKGNLKKKLEDIYFEDLVDTIDNEIEFIDGYYSR